MKINGKEIKIRKFPKAYVTIEEIEAASPCHPEYCGFLEDFKSNPLDKGGYTDRFNWDGLVYPDLKKPKYGPKDKIPLSKILRAERHTQKGHYGSKDRIRWILLKVPRLDKVQSSISRRASRLNLDWEELFTASFPRAVAAKSPAKPKKASKALKVK